MFRATCSLLLLLAGQVFADGWSSDIWPSQEHPMEGWRQLHECYTATVERCAAVNKTIPVTPTNRLDGYTSLTNIKDRIASVIPSFLDVSRLSSSSPVASNYFLGYTNKVSGAILVPYNTTTGLLAGLYLPTNYFAFTSRLGWSGLGPFTNDVTVGSPHGYTNVFTENGGTNWPGTRTKWYDTDYGIAPLTNILSKLTTTIILNSTICDARWYAEASYSFWPGDPVTAFPSLILAVTNAWTQITGTPNIIGNKKETLYAGAENGILRVGSTSVVFGVEVSNYTFAAEYYVHSSTNNFKFYTYDTFGVPLLESVFSLFQSETGMLTNMTVVSSSSFGGTNIPLPWVDYPTWDPPYQRWRGATYNGRTVLRWGVTNGFQFK